MRLNGTQRIIMTSLACGLVLCGAALGRQQVLKNGSFEARDPNSVDPNNIPNFWSQFGGAWQSTAFVADGAFSALTSVRDNAYVGLYQDAVSVQQNTRILMKALAYHPATAPLTGNVVAGIKLEFSPPEGIVIPPPEENLAFDANSPTDQWVLVQITTVVPPNIDTAQPVLINFEFPPDPNVPLTNGPLYADFASFETSSQPGVNLLTNGSFESGGGAQAPDGWTEFADPVSGVRRSAFEVPAYDGIAAAKFIGRTSGIYQLIPVNSGDTVTIKAYFRQRSALPWTSPYAKAGVKIQWSAGSYPSPNIDVAANSWPQSGTYNIITPASPTNTWLPVTIDFTVPAHQAAKLRATAINAFGTAASDAYFDAFEMVLDNVFNGCDANFDNAEDMLDIAALQSVYTGPGVALKYGGLVFDSNNSGDLTFDPDVTYALQNLAGPVTP